MKTITYCLIVVMLFVGCSATAPISRVDTPDSTQVRERSADDKIETLKFLVVGFIVFFIWVDSGK